MSRKKHNPEVAADSAVEAKPNNTNKFYRATKGHILPLYYKGAMIKIVETEAVELDQAILGQVGHYQSRVLLNEALRLKHVEEVEANNV